MTRPRFAKFGKMVLLALLRFVILLTILGIVTWASTTWQLVLLPIGVALFLGRYAFQLPQLRWGRFVRSRISPSWFETATWFTVARERLILSLRWPHSGLALLFSAVLVAMTVPFAVATLGGACIGEQGVPLSPNPRSASPLELGQSFAAILRMFSFVLIEEFLFRGWLLFPLRKLVGAPAAVAITSYLFAVGHLRPVGGLSYFFSGLVYGTATLLSGSIWVAVALHFTHNASLWAWDRFFHIFSEGAMACAFSRPMFALHAAALFLVLWLGRKRRVNGAAA